MHEDVVGFRGLGLNGRWWVWCGGGGEWEGEEARDYGVGEPGG